jgi:hypothetical protein
MLAPASAYKALQRGPTRLPLKLSQRFVCLQLALTSSHPASLLPNSLSEFASRGAPLRSQKCGHHINPGKEGLLGCLARWNKGKSIGVVASERHSYVLMQVTTSLRPPKCTLRLKAEKCGDYLASCMVGEKDSPVGERQTGRYAPEIRKVLQKHRNREKMPDWLAEGVGFEPTRPFRA